MLAARFPCRGPPTYAPRRPALITVMPCVEGLSDRRAAAAGCRRLAWQDALRLALADPGVDFSVLSECRARLVAGAQEPRLLETLLTHVTARGVLRARGPQRPDSPRGLAAIRRLNRLASVGEPWRAARHSLAMVAPEGLLTQVAPEGCDRHRVRVEEDRLPKGQEARTADAARIGTDGFQWLEALEADAAAARGRRGTFPRSASLPLGSPLASPIEGAHRSSLSGERTPLANAPRMPYITK
jgi:transposase